MAPRIVHQDEPQEHRLYTYSRTVLLLQLFCALYQSLNHKNGINKIESSKGQMRGVQWTWSGPRLPSWLYQHCSIACQSISVITLSEGVNLYQLPVQLLEPLLASSNILRLIASISWQHTYVPNAWTNPQSPFYDCHIQMHSVHLGRGGH